MDDITSATGMRQIIALMESAVLGEGYRETIAKFNQMASADEVEKAINTYRDLVNRNQVQGNERNIDWWRKQGWELFKKFVASKSTQPSATQVKRRRAAGTSITLKETDQWLIVIPLDHDASCFHGRDTEWCTARPTGHYFDHYFLDKGVNLLYVINKTSGAKYAIASHPRIDRMELFDQLDKSITAEQFGSATGFAPADLVRLIPINDPRIAHARVTRRELLSLVEERMEQWRRGDPHRDAELEELLIKSKHGTSCVEYIRAVGARRRAQAFPEVISLAAIRTDDEDVADEDEDVTDEDEDRIPLIAYISEPSRTVQLAAVKQNGLAIRYIKNPSPEMQLAAVQQNGLVIEYIKNPSPEMQLAAVQQTGYAIQHIENPTPEMQLAAVKQYGDAIEYIKNPTPEAQVAAVKQNGDAIEYIKNPTPEAQVAAVKQHGFAIRHIENPTPEAQVAAVQQNGIAIHYIKNPSPEMQLVAVKQNGIAIRYIKNPSPEMQLAAVKQNGLVIEYIKNPSPEMQLAAVQQNGIAIHYIKNPSPEMQLAAVQQNGDAIRHIKNPTPAAIELARTKGT